MRENKIDLLLYSHDGRGHGHVSRSIAIGLALLRLRPRLRVLLLTGSSYVSELLSEAKLDWIKLPSFRSVMVEGRSRPIDGPSNLAHRTLCEIRRGIISDLIQRLNPKCVLVDYLPLGKGSELVDSISFSARRGTRWVLGIRAIPGDLDQITTPLAKDILMSVYSRVFWYGDSSIHGFGIREQLEREIGVPLFETGLVARALELSKAHYLPTLTEELTGAVGISWCDSRSVHTLLSIKRALISRCAQERWRIFAAPAGHFAAKDIEDVCGDSDSLNIERLSSVYLSALKNSRVIITFGGYNSITDVLWSSKPALFITRDCEEEEQPHHVACIRARFGSGFEVLSETAASPMAVTDAVDRLLSLEGVPVCPDVLNGSERAARMLLEIIEGSAQ